MAVSSCARGFESPEAQLDCKLYQCPCPGHTPIAMPRLRILRVIATRLLAGLLLLPLVPAFYACEIVRYSHVASTQSAQAAVVLGAAAWGNRPSPVYRERLNEALRLYRQGRVGKLIFTGGTPERGYPSEAAVAREYARQHGVPDDAILVDVKSRSTLENLVQARTLMQGADVQTVLLVSDPLHMLRAMSIARQLGIAAQPAPTDSSQFQSWPQRAKFLWRETWSYTEHRLFQRFHSNASESHNPDEEQPEQ